MIDIFEPLNYEIPDPMPSEILNILDSKIERYAIHTLTCSQYMRTAESFFRFKKNNFNTNHIEYVNKKTFEIYQLAKNINPESIILRIDYLLESGVMIGVYIQQELLLMMGCIRGYRAEMMTEAEFQNLWYGTSNS